MRKGGLIVKSYNIIKSNDFKFTYSIELNQNSLVYNGGNFSINDFVENNTINNYEYTELSIFEFDNCINKNDKWDYTASILSGVIAAGIDIFFVNEFSLKEAANWGKKEVSDFVLSFAKLNGYKGDDLTDAIRSLEKKFILPSDKLTHTFGGGLQHHLRDFIHHPTPIGLFFSILSQITHKGFGTDIKGNFIIRDIPLDTFTSTTIVGQIYDGVVTWLFHLISDMAGSSSSISGGTGIPGYLLSTLKEISALPLIKDIKLHYQDNDIELTKFISKLFNGTFFKNENPKENIRFDLRTEIGILKELSNQTIPVIINECIVRAFFTIRRFSNEIISNEITKFADLAKINYTKVLPYKNEALNRMLSLATGTFTVIDASHAMIYSALKNKSFNPNSLKDFLVRINIVGIGRFTLACKIELESFKAKQIIKKASKINSIPELKEMTLDRKKTSILYSLELLKCNLDIESTKNPLDKEIKKLWVDSWINATQSTLKESDDFWIKDITILTESINDELANTVDDSWMDIISLELSVFIPYYPLNSEHDSKYQKLKFNLKSFDKVLASIQDYESIKDIKDIYKEYKKNHDLLSGKNTKQAIGTIGAVVVTTVTGGLAFYFAPQIATLLVGSSFVGLHGAALTSASLAMLGGGSLAVGGLGMAGGTMVIAGGGTILGLTASGLTNKATTLLFSNSDYTLKECSKLLTITKYTILNKYSNIEVAERLLLQLNNRITSLTESYDEISTTIENKKEIIRGIKNSIKYLKKTSLELEKVINKTKKAIHVIQNEKDAFNIYLKHSPFKEILTCQEYNKFYLFVPKTNLAGPQPYIIYKKTGKVKNIHFTQLYKLEKQLIRVVNIKSFNSK